MDILDVPQHVELGKEEFSARVATTHRLLGPRPSSVSFVAVLLSRRHRRRRHRRLCF